MKLVQRINITFMVNKIHVVTALVIKFITSIKMIRHNVQINHLVPTYRNY